MRLHVSGKERQPAVRVEQVGEPGFTRVLFQLFRHTQVEKQVGFKHSFQLDVVSHQFFIGVTGQVDKLEVLSDDRVSDTNLVQGSGVQNFVGMVRSDNVVKRQARNVDTFGSNDLHLRVLVLKQFRSHGVLVIGDNKVGDVERFLSHQANHLFDLRAVGHRRPDNNGVIVVDGGHASTEIDDVEAGERQRANGNVAGQLTRDDLEIGRVTHD